MNSINTKNGILVENLLDFTKTINESVWLGKSNLLVPENHNAL